VGDQELLDLLVDREDINIDSVQPSVYVRLTSP
jgi:hypothetical protein